MTVRLNALPLALAPGVALVGLLVDGVQGLLVALGLWLALLAIGTGISVARHLLHGKGSAGGPPSSWIRVRHHRP
jgi:hypothetical protein